MEDLSPHLRPFTDLSLEDDWSAKPSMHGLDGTAIRMEFRYVRRLPADIGGMSPTDNYVELWWHDSKDRYAIKGPHISEQYCDSTEEAKAELYQALGETRALVERARLIGEFGDIDGVGHATLTRFHRTFGTVEGVYQTDRSELLAIPHVTGPIVDEIERRERSPRHLLAEADDSQVELGSGWQP